MVKVDKLTDIRLTWRMLEHTVPHIDKSVMNYKTLYKQGHSIQRSQLFYIEFTGIPTGTMGHFRTHSGAGQVWLLQSNRPDWNGGKKADRDTPINASLICNAEHLIQIAKLRLCSKAHMNTVKWMRKISRAVKKVDPDLYLMLQPKCFYHGYCNESKSCGYVERAKVWRKSIYGVEG